MALLKDTTVSGSLRATDTIYSTTAQFQILRAPTTSGGTTYGPGTSGQILKSNGTSVYWAADSSTTDLTSMTGTLGVDHGGTGSTTATGARTNLGLGSMATEAATDYLKLTGGSLSGNLTVRTSNPSIDVADTNATRTDGSFRLVFNISSGGKQGIWSSAYATTTDKTTINTTAAWLMYRDIDGKTYLKGNADTATAANLTTTANAIAYYTNTTGTFGTKASANGALYATSSNGTLNWGTLPIAQGGTSSTTATGARNNLGLGNAKIFYGTCSTAAGTVAKEVECADFSSEELVKGAMIFVTFTNTNSGAVGSLTMDVNSTGAKNIKKHYNNAAPSNLTGVAELQANNTYLFIYNGTFWVLMTSDYNTQDLTYIYGASGSSRVMETAANGGIGSHRYALEMMTANQTWSAIAAVSGSTDANQGTAVAKVASTANFLLNAPILYTNTNAYTAPGSSHNLVGYITGSLDLRYSIGTTASNVSLTIQKPVYLVGKINSDRATFKLDATQWWTQNLPTSNDGKIYIFLGMAYSTASIYLSAWHPIYYHNGITVNVYNPGIHIKDETPLVNESNEYISVPAASVVAVKDAAATSVENAIITIDKKQQSYNGYDRPWTAGGSKNIYSIKIGRDNLIDNEGSSHSTDSDELTINMSTNSRSGIWSYDNSVLYHLVNTLSGAYTFSADIKSNTDNEIIFDASTVRTVAVTTSWTRVSVTITLPLNKAFTIYNTGGKTCTVYVKNFMIEAGSSHDGNYEPYENICPLESWGSVAVTRMGKNLIGINGSINTQGNIVNSDYSIRSDIIPVTVGNIFTASKTTAFTNSSHNMVVREYDENHTFLASKSIMPYNSLIGSYTVGNSVAYVGFVQFYEANTDISPYNIQLELGSTATSYEPYHSDILPITLPSSVPVYGGTIDYAAKKLLVDWAEIDSYAGEALPGEWMSSMEPYAAGTTPTTGAQVAYKLTTPVEYRFDPRDIVLFNGANIISVNCGTISFDYHTNIYPVSIDKNGNLAVQISSNISCSSQAFDVQYSISTPTTRSDGISALQEGDLWFKPSS